MNHSLKRLGDLATLSSSLFTSNSFARDLCVVLTSFETNFRIVFSAHIAKHLVCFTNGFICGDLCMTSSVILRSFLVLLLVFRQHSSNFSHVWDLHSKWIAGAWLGSNFFETSTSILKFLVTASVMRAYAGPHNSFVVTSVTSNRQSFKPVQQVILWSVLWSYVWKARVVG